MIVETILIIVLVILLLVVSHEFGHFITAKWFGVRVDEFGIGLPPRLFGKRFGETLYSVNLLPFGGFVRILGEDDTSNDPRSFSGQKIWIRSLIVAAGVVANTIVAFILLSFLSWFGTPLYAVGVGGVITGSPAEQAGFREGDIIIGIEGIEREKLDVEEVQSYIDVHRGGEAAFIVMRNTARVVLIGKPRLDPPQGQGALGILIGSQEIGVKRSAWYTAPWEGLKATLSLLRTIALGMVFFFSKFFETGTAPGGVVGPVGIAKIAQETFHIGVYSFLSLVAFLALNLAVMNVLPIPALDGGRLLFFIIEKIKGKPIRAEISRTIHSVFMVLLIVLLVWVTYHDIVHPII